MNGIGISSLTLFGLLATGPTNVPDTAPGLDHEAFFRRTMSRSAERAQVDLMESTVLWEDHSSWDDPWRIRTPHYEVVTTGSRLNGLEVAHGLETMLGHFQDVTGLDHVPSAPFPILVHPDIAGYNTFGDSVGAEHSSFYGSFYAGDHADRPVATFKTRNTARQLMWVTHGATHQFLASASAATLPAWLDEGLASFFARSWGYALGVAELRLAVNSGEFVPLSQLLTGNIADFADRPELRLLELSMLFNYLMYFRPDTRTVVDETGAVTAAPFRDYLRARVQGRPTAGTQVEALLTRGRSQLERDFRAFKDWK